MILRKIDSRNLLDLLASMLCILLVAGVLVGRLWIRSQIAGLGYATQGLQATEESLVRTQQDLILEEETLKHPERIENIARNEMSMEPLQPNQLIPRFRDIEAGRPAALALADARQTAVPPRRSSANN
jgi:cell division protein FtsL